MIVQPLQLPVIEVRELVVSFARWGQGVTAIDHLSFDASPGEWLLIVGHNGAGKSTLLKTIAGRVLADGGEIRINGHSFMSPHELAVQTFLVHQDPLLGTAPLLTVFENLAVADPAAMAAGASSANLIQKYSGLLEPIGLAHRLKQPVKLLSGGERQLLAMTISGLRPSPIILLDEALSALDPEKTLLCIEQISRLHAAGRTIIQVAHDTRYLEDAANRMLTLHNGRLQSDERLSLAPPTHAYQSVFAGRPVHGA